MARTAIARWIILDLRPLLFDLGLDFISARISIVGNGKQTRDFIHVDDLTNAFIKLAKSGLKNKIYNLGSGKETSINKIASIIGGKKTFIPKRPGDPSRSCANILKIKKDINWKPKISIKQGIKRLFLN